jgi:hypothetical protein
MILTAGQFVYFSAKDEFCAKFAVPGIGVVAGKILGHSTRISISLLMLAKP